MENFSEIESFLKILGKDLSLEDSDLQKLQELFFSAQRRFQGELEGEFGRAALRSADPDFVFIVRGLVEGVARVVSAARTTEGLKEAKANVAGVLSTLVRNSFPASELQEEDKSHGHS